MVKLRANSPRPTTNDIARAAGVSLATVDRVLNERPGVRRKTIERVQSAIVELGYVRDAAAANLARGRRYRLLFVLPEGDNEFVNALVDQIDENSTRALPERTDLGRIQVPAFDSRSMARALGELDPAQYDGIAIFAPETPSIRDAIDGLRANGVAVVTLVSDLPSSRRNHFVGINNIAAGRTAGLLMGRFVREARAKILVLAGSMLEHDHLERRLGFDAVMAEAFPDFTVLPSLEGRDDPELQERILPVAFEANPDIRGIYAMSTRNAGVVKYLRETNRQREVVVIAHELTGTSRDALADDTFDAVISQDTGHLIRSAIRVLRAESDGLEINPSQETIRIDVFLKENMPPIVQPQDH
ncbi:LacI family DNA-binding transcriptional regulator [Rhodobacteraceae bacterium NNCM2]|nr:LacI family DNA-binding transcriptional regulator [Coraliihabitans acroporae]